MTTYAKPICIEDGDLTLDIIGHYVESGRLDHVEINGRDIPASYVKSAMSHLGCDCPGWDADLDSYTMTALINAAERDARTVAE